MRRKHVKTDKGGPFGRARERERGRLQTGGVEATWLTFTVSGKGRSAVLGGEALEVRGHELRSGLATAWTAKLRRGREAAACSGL